MGEPGDETHFLQKQVYKDEADPDGDPNAARYDEGKFRAILIQRMDLLIDLTKKNAVATATLARELQKQTPS